MAVPFTVIRSCSGFTCNGFRSLNRCEEIMCNSFSEEKRQSARINFFSFASLGAKECQIFFPHFFTKTLKCQVQMTELQPVQVTSVATPIFPLRTLSWACSVATSAVTWLPRGSSTRPWLLAVHTGKASSGKRQGSAVLTSSTSPCSWLRSALTSKRSRLRKNVSVLWYFHLLFQYCVLWDSLFALLWFHLDEQIFDCEVPWESLPIRCLDCEHSWPCYFVCSGNPLKLLEVLPFPHTHCFSGEFQGWCWCVETENISFKILQPKWGGMKGWLPQTWACSNCC